MRWRGSGRGERELAEEKRRRCEFEGGEGLDREERTERSDEWQVGDVEKITSVVSFLGSSLRTS